MKSNGRQLLLLLVLLVLVITFIVYSTNYANESSKVFFVFSEIEIHDNKSPRGSELKFIKKSTKLPETALPTKSLK